MPGPPSAEATACIPRRRRTAATPSSSVKRNSPIIKSPIDLRPFSLTDAMVRGQTGHSTCQRPRSRSAAEALRNRDVRDVRAPHLVRTVDRQTAQQVRVNPVLGVGHAGARLPVDRLHAHQPHQTAHPVPADDHALAAQMARHLPAAVECMLQVQLVQPAHQRQVLRALPKRLVVLRRATHAEQPALARQREAAAAVDHRGPLRTAQRANPRRKKSRSTGSSPIFA